MKKGNQRIYAVSSLMFLGILMTLNACDSKTSPLVTIASNDVGKFAARDARVCIISFTADPRLSSQGSGGLIQAAKQAALDPTSGSGDVPSTILKLRYLRYVSALSSRYQLIGGAQPRLDKLAYPTDRRWIEDTVKNKGADFGICVHDQYGVDWGDNTLANLVDAYTFRVTTTVYDSNGNRVWQFISRGKAEDPFRYSHPFAEAATGNSSQPLTAGNAANIYAKFIEYYPRLEEALIGEDAAGKPHLGEGDNWCPYIGKTYKDVALFIVNDNSESYSDIFQDIDK